MDDAVVTIAIWVRVEIEYETATNAANLRGPSYVKNKIVYIALTTLLITCLSNCLIVYNNITPINICGTLILLKI